MAEDDWFGLIGRDLDDTSMVLTTRLAGAFYTGPWTFDPEAFPATLKLVPRLTRVRTAWRVGTHRYDDEATARAVAEEYGSRARRVKVRRVPKGTAAVRRALAVLEECLAAVPPWDDMERRRRVATEAYSKATAVRIVRDPNVPNDRVYGFSGLETWLPNTRPLVMP